MLLVYHIDKNDNQIEEFKDEELRMELGFFPKQNTHVKLKMVGFSNDTEGGIVYMNFPDLIGGELEEEIGDFTDAFEVPGLAIGADEGGFLGGAAGTGRFYDQSDTRIFNLDLGRMDTQKDYFRIIVNARRGTDFDKPRINLNNFSCILEMSHGSANT
jgi:hypothetical protein